MYRKRNKGWLKHLDFAVLDLMCMQICLALAYFGRHRELSRLYSDSVYQNVVLLLAVFEFVYLFFIDGYRDILKRGYYIELVTNNKEFSPSFDCRRITCFFHKILTRYPPINS